MEARRCLERILEVFGYFDRLKIKSTRTCNHRLKGREKEKETNEGTLKSKTGIKLVDDRR